MELDKHSAIPEEEAVGDIDIVSRSQRSIKPSGDMQTQVKTSPTGGPIQGRPQHRKVDHVHKLERYFSLNDFLKDAAAN